MDHTDVVNSLEKQFPHGPLTNDAFKEFLGSVIPFLKERNGTEEEYLRLIRLCIPERTITFKVIWEDDKGTLQTNLGYRVQYNSALGPYKGGLRFDTSVTPDVLTFLGFEQIFKNALTGLPLGGGKGGSDFDPKGKSDAEVRRFCSAFMGELSRYIGAQTDVPAGDIGVGAREIGYLYGAYKKIANRTDGTMTGKGVGYGGSHIRTEATGYGAVYFIEAMLTHAGKNIHSMRALVSGSGNVATHVAEKLIAVGALPLTLSDRGGYIYAEEGLTQNVVDAVKELKDRDGKLSELALTDGVVYHEGKVWGAHDAELIIPSATQHELNREDAVAVVDKGALLIAEAANMPSTLDAIEYFKEKGILFGPAKAVNAGGVAVSGLEMRQNASHAQWPGETVDGELHAIMRHIHEVCVLHGGAEGGKVDYVKGANIGGFLRVFEAMRQLGW
jgi:glutamate dehydrogenase (NADP+)